MRRTHCYHFLVFEAFPVIFIGRHNFSIAQTGLIFIGVGIGTSLGSLINYFASAHYPQLIQKWRGFPPPEDRLYGAMLGSPVLVIGIFWLGWTGEYASVPWYVPAISTIFIGAGISLIFMSFLVCSLYKGTNQRSLLMNYFINRVILSTHTCELPLSAISMCC